MVVKLSCLSLCVTSPPLLPNYSALLRLLLLYKPNHFSLPLSVAVSLSLSLSLSLCALPVNHLVSLSYRCLPL